MLRNPALRLYLAVVKNFIYLTDNFKSTSEKYDFKYYDWDNSKLCAFTQEFDNEIKYSVSECKEGAGLSVILDLPKINRNELMKWVEGIYEVAKWTNDKYVWKKDNSKFEPEEIICGCYFKIEEKEKTTLIDLYCGC